MECVRYEIFDHEDKCYGGFLHDVSCLEAPASAINPVVNYWNKNLPVTPCMEGSFRTYFTPAGVRRFKRGIKSLVGKYSKYPFYCGSFDCIMTVRETRINIENLPEQRVCYRDDYQIVVAE